MKPPSLETVKTQLERVQRRLHKLTLLGQGGSLDDLETFVPTSVILW